jgi:hypothetical protein
LADAPARLDDAEFGGVFSLLNGAIRRLTGLAAF